MGLHQGEQFAGSEEQAVRHLRRQASQDHRREEVQVLRDGQVPQGSHVLSLISQQEDFVLSLSLSFGLAILNVENLRESFSVCVLEHLRSEFEVFVLIVFEAIEKE